MLEINNIQKRENTSLTEQIGRWSINMCANIDELTRDLSKIMWIIDGCQKTQYSIQKETQKNIYYITEKIKLS